MFHNGTSNSLHHHWAKLIYVTKSPRVRRDGRRTRSLFVSSQIFSNTEYCQKCVTLFVISYCKFGLLRSLPFVWVHRTLLAHFPRHRGFRHHRYQIYEKALPIHLENQTITILNTIVAKRILTINHKKRKAESFLTWYVIFFNMCSVNTIYAS